MDRFRRTKQEEDGAALVTVVILSLFVFTVVLALATTTAMGSKIQAQQRNDIEAFAFAEAGRDAALVELAAGRCATPVSSATEPRYTYRVYRYKASGNEVPRSLTQTGVQAGCPVADTTHVLVETVGKSGHDKAIVSTFRWSKKAVTSINGAIGSGQNLTLSGFTVELPSGAPAPADIVVNAGNFKCEGSNNRVPGSVYIKAGNIENLGGCSTITGNVSASGNVAINHGNTRAIDGNLCARGGITLVQPNNVGGSRQSYATSCPGLDVEGWVDYDPALDGSIPGWNVLKLTSANQCRQDPNTWNNNKVHDIIELIQGYPYHTSSPDRFIAPLTTPTLIDATICPTVQLDQGSTFALRTDITIVGKSFIVRNNTINSYDGLAHSFNIVVPDKTVTTPAMPHCPPSYGHTFQVQNNNMASSISGLIYNSCSIGQITGTWRGQIFGGVVGSNISNGKLVYVPVFTPGLTTTGGNANVVPELLSQIEP